MSMELIKPGIHLDFVGKMKYAIIFSVILTIISYRICYFSWRLKPWN